MSKALVKCKICGEQFDRNSEPYVEVEERRYAHLKCFENYVPTQEELDLKELHSFLQNLFKDNYNYRNLSQQIESYVNTKGYTYSGILKTLKYWYEVQGHSIEKSNYRIGIVPYVYEDAKDYYYTLWTINNQNINKITAAKPTKVTVVIKKPDSNNTLPIKLFDLDDED